MLGKILRDCLIRAGTPNAVSKPNNPDPVTELPAKRLSFACPFRLRPELQPPSAGENCEQVLTHQLKLLAFFPVVAGPGVAGSCAQSAVSTRHKSRGLSKKHALGLTTLGC
jgi:hypothetical protein